MNKLVVAFAVGLALIAPSALAQSGTMMTKSAPGKVGVAETTKMTATITAIDKAAREVTLKGPQGNEVTLGVGPEAKNFDNMKVGDVVNVEYVEALTLELKKGGGLPVARTEESAMKGAKAGEKPAGVAGRQVTIVADVIGVDAAKQMVTLKGPQRTVDLKVRDPEQFKLIHKGDQVQATYTQAMALKVEAAPAAAKK